MLRLKYLVPLLVPIAACAPTSATQPGAVYYELSAQFAASAHLSEADQVLVVLVPARDTDEARQDAMYYCNGLREWQDATPSPASPHRCVRN